MIKRNFGLILLIIVSAIPLLVWFPLKSIDERFGSSISTFVSLGQASAILGLTLFSLNFLLSTRLKFLDDIFGGINRVYIIHHFIGGLAFILLLFHPIFLLARTLPYSLINSAKFLLPEGYVAKDLGIYSLWLMILLLVLTFFVSLKYEFWKNSHKLLGIAFFIGGIHGIIIYSDIQNNLSLKIIMIFIVSVGLISYIYRTVFGKWLIKKYKYKLIDKEIIQNNVVNLTFKAENEAIKYKSGQFVFINFEGKSVSAESHPFSISSGEDERTFTLTIKNLGDYTASLKDVSVGEMAYIEGPFGKFNYKNSNKKNQVWIAGGIGVTPFLGMTKQLIKENDLSYNIDFFYCTKSPEEQKLIGKIFKGRNQINNIKYIPHCSLSQGRVNAEFIKNNSQDIGNSDVFICGPVPMMKGLKKQFRQIKIKSIISEEFSF